MVKLPEKKKGERVVFTSIGVPVSLATEFKQFCRDLNLPANKGVELAMRVFMARAISPEVRKLLAEKKEVINAAVADFDRRIIDMVGGPES